MGKGLANTRRIKLNHFDTLIRFWSVTRPENQQHGTKKVRTELATLYCQFDYISRKQEEKTIGGRERSVQQATALTRYNASITKTTEMEIMDTGEIYDVIGIHRDTGRIGQFLEVIGEVRD